MGGKGPARSVRCASAGQARPRSCLIARLWPLACCFSAGGATAVGPGLVPPPFRGCGAARGVRCSCQKEGRGVLKGLEEYGGNLRGCGGRKG